MIKIWDFVALLFASLPAPPHVHQNAGNGVTH